MKPINLSYLDTAGAMAGTGGGTGARLRRGITRGESHVIDVIDCSGFNDGGGETYMPSVFKLELKYVRANKQVVLMVRIMLI